MMIRIGVISDTHLGAASEQLVEQLVALWGNLDLILHAGDITSPSVIKALNRIAETVSVAGNMDGSGILPRSPRSRMIEVEDCLIGLIHGDIRTVGRSPLRGQDGEALNSILHPHLRDRFPGAHCIVFGHTHCPHNTLDDRILFLNPGAFRLGQASRAPTVGRLTAETGQIKGEILHIPDGSSS